MKASRDRLQSGGALVMVLLVLIVSGSLVAGWLAAHAQQTVYVDTLDEASMRRIACENGAAVARQYVLDHVVASSSGPGTSQPISLPNGWGTVEIEATGTTPMGSEARAAGWNHFNWGNGEGYSGSVSAKIRVSAALSEGMKARFSSATPPVLEIEREYLVRSRSPVLSGDLYIANNPGDSSIPVSVSGDVTVNGRAVLWMPESPNSYSLTMSSFTTRSTPSTDLSGLPGNFPFPPVTTGSTGGVTYYDGRLDVVSNDSDINCLLQKVQAMSPAAVSVDGSAEMEDDGIECDGEGRVEIDLHEPSLGNVIIHGNVSTLVLEGQSSSEDFENAGTYRSMSIIVDQTSSSVRDLATVQMTRRSNRRLVLAIKKASGTATAFDVPNAGDGPWRAICVLEGTPAEWAVPGGATLALYGGVQTNRALSVSGGAVSIYPEPDPFLLERLTPRDAWVESYQDDQDY